MTALALASFPCCSSFLAPSCPCLRFARTHARHFLFTLTVKLVSLLFFGFPSWEFVLLLHGGMTEI